MPNVSSCGSSCLSSRTTSEACRSPEASPATMASFMKTAHPVARLPGCPVAEALNAHTLAWQPGNLATWQPSFQWERVHPPRQGDAAEEERQEDEEEKADALGARLFPEQREEERG